MSTINNDDLNTLGNSIIVSSQPNSSDENTLINFLNGCGATMAFIGSTIGILAAFWTLLNTFKDIFLLYISINLVCASFSFFVYALANCFSGNDLGIGGMISGIGIGLIITAIFSLFIMTSSFSKWNPLTYTSLFASALSLVLSFTEILFPDETLGIEIYQIILGLLTLLFGTLAATSLLEPDSTKKTLLGFAFLSLGLAYGLTFTIIGIIIMLLNL